MMKVLIAVTLILTIAGIISCKKSADKKANCRLSAITPVPAGDVFHLTYDGNGKLIRVVSGPRTTQYAYNGNMVLVTQNDGGNLITRTLITLNAAGLATNVRVDQDAAGTNWVNTAFEYNGDELTRSTETTSIGAPALVTLYTWVDHNMVSLSIAGGQTTLNFGFYLDKPRQSGDFISVVQLLQGYETTRSKNLMKSYAGSNFTYIFGNDGKISSISSVAGNNTSFLDYEYQCN